MSGYIPVGGHKHRSNRLRKKREKYQSWMINRLCNFVHEELPAILREVLPKYPGSMLSILNND